MIVSDNFALNKVRFFEYGKQAPSHSRFKGTMNQAALVGYYEYTSDENKNEKSSELDNLKEGGYLGYVDKDEYTFISEFDGWLNEDNRKEFEHMLSDSFSKNGDLWWETVISLKSEEIANGYGLETPEDYKTLVDRCIPKFCKMMKLDQENVIWWANRHVDTQHPHIHLNWLEKGQNKTRTRGKITDKELKRLKNIVATELNHMKEIKFEIDDTWKKNVFKKKDEAFHELINAIGKNAFDKNIVTLSQLYSILPKQGRLGYNSYVMKPYKPLIDSITKKIINDREFKGLFNNYVEMLEKLANYQNQSLSSEGNIDIATIKDTEIDKLYSRIGNMIIQDFKKKRIQKSLINTGESDGGMELVPSLEEMYHLNSQKRFTINIDLIEDFDEQGLFVRIPRTGGQKYMYLSDENCKQIGEETWQFDFDADKTFKIYDQNKNFIEKAEGSQLLKFWDEKKKDKKVRLEKPKMEQVPSYYVQQISSDNPADSYLAFTINKSLIKEFDKGRIFCRIPRTKATKFMYLEQDQWQQVNQYTLRYFFDPNKKVKVYTEGKSFMEEISGRDLLKYWDKKNISELTEKEKGKLNKQGKRRRTRENDNQLIEMTSKPQFDESLYRKKKTIGYYIKRARRWQKGRNFGISDSEIYREMMEWERQNDIGQKL